MTQDCCGTHGCAQHTQMRATPRHALWVQWLTILWMLAECGIALWSAARARSVALLGFGGDSLIELLSAVVALATLLPAWRGRRAQADRWAAVLLYLLAGFLLVAALAELRLGAHPESSTMGMAITAAALVAMPLLAVLKRRAARASGNRALAADAMQSATCAMLAAITLASLWLNARWHLPWLDAVASMALVPVLVVEGRKAASGEGCGCH